VTKSKLVGRGGARAGSGRKPKPVAGPAYVAGEPRSDAERRQASDASAAPIIPAGLSLEERHKFLEDLADETIATIMATGTSESARVAAARDTRDRIRGRPRPGVAAKPDEPDMFDDHWGSLLDVQQPARKN
jgi:hypothetical protein